MPAIEVTFQGDQAFLNSLQGAPGVERNAERGGFASSVPDKGMGESAYDVARAIAGKLGVGPAFESIASSVQEVRSLARDIRAAFGGGAGPASSGTTSAAASNAARMAAGGASGATGASGAGVAAGAEAGLVLAATVAAAVVALGLFTVGVKKTVDVLNSEVDKLKDISPEVGVASSLIELNQQLRMMDRGQKIGPQLQRFMFQQDKFNEQLTNLTTEFLTLALKAWESGRPVLEMLHDVLATVPYWSAAISNAFSDIWNEFSRFTGGLAGRVPRLFTDDEVKARGEASKAAFETDNLGLAGKEDALGKRANELADKILSGFGTGGRKPIPPRRD